MLRVTKVLVTVSSGEAMRITIVNIDGSRTPRPTLAPGEAKYFSLIDGARMELEPAKLAEGYRANLGLKD